jgi:hypothetical protein
LNTGTRGVRATLGPAPVSASAGTFVAFASAPGTVAEDGTGRNSPFTAAILQQIETPGLEVRQMMGRVRQSVREQTQGRQIPWENSSLEGNFYFRPPEVERSRPEAGMSSSALNNRDADLVFWESIKNSRSENEYQAYIERFPSGVFAPLARVRMQQFAMVAPPAASGTGLVPTSESMITVERTALRADPSGGADVVGQLDAWTEIQATARTRDGKWFRVRGREGEAYVPTSSVKLREVAQAEEWQRAETGNTIESYAEYLERFPRSDRAQVAGRRIEELRAATARNSSQERPPQVAAERFDAARVPLVKAGDRSRLKLYASVKREKALAISARGEFAWATQMASLQEAERIALERCEYVAGQPCSIYARNDEAQIPTGGEWRPDGSSKVLPDGRFADDEIPFLTDADRRRLKDYANARSPKALAVHPDGRHASATGRANDHEAQQQALSRCQGQSRDPCVLFAANDVVVLDKRASRPIAEPAVSMASVPLAAPVSPQPRQQPAPAAQPAVRSLAYDGLWRLRVDCGREDSAFDIAVVNGAVSFGERIKFGGVGSGPAILSGSVASGGKGVVTGSWNVDRWRSNPAHTEAMSLYLTFIGTQVSGYASVGPRGPCPVTGRRR